MLRRDQHLDLVVILGEGPCELHPKWVSSVSAKGHEQEAQRPRGHRFGFREGGNQHGRRQFFGLSRGRRMKLLEGGDDRPAREQVDPRGQDGSSFFNVLMNGISRSTPSIIPGFNITSESST